jgi:hypothetical protein
MIATKRNVKRIVAPEIHPLPVFCYVAKSTIMERPAATNMTLSI